jgi:hypothetical protein
MHPALNHALAQLTASTSGAPSSSLTASLETLVNEFGEHNLAERIAEELPPTTPSRFASELLTRLVWHTSDNGAQIHATVEQWLREAPDDRLVSVALGVEEFFPFASHHEMEQVLRSIARRFPWAAERCSQLIQARRAASAA